MAKWPEPETIVGYAVAVALAIMFVSCAVRDAVQTWQ